MKTRGLLLGRTRTGCAIAAFLANSTAFALLPICPNLSEFVNSGRKDSGKRNSVKKEVEGMSLLERGTED